MFNKIQQITITREKNVATNEKYTLRQMGGNFNPLNSTFMQIFLLKKLNSFGVGRSWGGNETILEQVIVVEHDYMLQFLKKIKLYTELVPKTVCWVYTQNYHRYLMKYFLQLEHYIELMAHL